MARKTTIISTITNGGGGGGVVVLGAIGVAIGLFAIDRHYSRKGHSAFDKLTRGYFTGLDAPWSELAANKKISAPMQGWIQQVVQKAMDSEDAQTLQQLAANLAAAGLHQIADAVRAAGQKK